MPTASRTKLPGAQRWLDVACGSNKHPGACGMDKRKLDGVDVVHDIEELPWPFGDEEFTRLIMSHIVEHLKPWLMVPVMDEAWRVLEPGGQVMIATPYAGSFGFNQDPSHVHGWNEATPHYFDPERELYKVYEPKPWKILQSVWQMYGNLEILMEKRA
jgi:predicted SAM-dependent methyltransferase